MTTKLDNAWRLRALTRAQSLEGKEHSPIQLEVIEASRQAHGEEWAIFMAFGIQPEYQAYINGTINILEKEIEDWPGQRLIAAIRLKWSCKELLQ